MIGSLVYSQFLPGNSWLHRLDPRCKLVLLAGLTVGLFYLQHAPAQLLLFGLVCLIPVTVGVPLKMLRPAFLGVLPLGLLTLLFQAGWGPEPSWHHLSLAGLEEGGLLALRLLDLAVLAQLLALTTSPIGLCDAAEQILYPLGKVGLPHRDLALSFTIAWRFIPVLAQETEKLLKSQISRGAAWEEGPWHRRLMTLTALLTPLMIRCFRYAEELALALEARGYGQAGRPTRLHPLQWRWFDALALLGGLAVMLGLIAWESFL
ncbi:MAG: energy-coupling factor transporter transmembrane protein EcfT [Candidatus Eremiobacteraeota bacterium]|nr:energy-coupling factor transporter transmembrane protein EcfT [Candidatus Eremiobacteraeota bacterium]MCW5871322.1 energy-coupling factor transporter transmembrane protein EcfT [Candidatus Eremiobacteraeota bacterium]